MEFLPLVLSNALGTLKMLLHLLLKLLIFFVLIFGVPVIIWGNRIESPGSLGLEL